MLIPEPDFYLSSWLVSLNFNNLAMKIEAFKLERYYSNHEMTAKYPLCNSDCEAMTIKDLLAMEEGAVDRFHELWLGYTETQGHPDLRRDIATIYDGISEEEVLVCTGAQEPIYLFSQACLDSQDHVIVQWPCYQSLESVPASIGCQISHWNVRYIDDKPTFDVGELAELMTNQTKIIYLNSPHNPTGYHFTLEDQKAIVELARKHQVIVFCDEVYRELEHAPEYKIPAFADAYERGVSLGVMSKSYGLPGLRIGWIASQERSILSQVAKMKDYTTICNSGPSEFLAGVALRNRKQILERNIKMTLDNKVLFSGFFERHQDLFSWYEPHAGPISFVKMKTDVNDKAFAKAALDHSQILLLPGHIYDYPGYFRVGFGRRSLKESLQQFEKFITTYFD